MKYSTIVTDTFANRFGDSELQKKILTWILGIDSELIFWSRWFATKGLQWPDDYVQRVGGQLEFPYPELLEGIVSPRVLDVGAGPISRLGDIAKGKRIQLFACDPLAFAYERFAKRAGVQPYVITEFALSERLCDIYPENSFDLVHMSNALDHAINPFLGLYSMLAVCKIGGTVVLYHRENEAQVENYAGLHQWNISEKLGDLVFGDSNSVTNVTDVLKDIAHVTIERHEDPDCYGSMILAKIVKTKNFSFSTNYMNMYDMVMAQVSFYLLSSVYRECTDDEENIAKLKGLAKMNVGKHAAWLETLLPSGTFRRRIAGAARRFLRFRRTS